MSEPTWIGKTIGGRYQIEELLGQGGMSAVYKAIDPNLRRAVAVKIIHPHLSGDPEFVRRFEEEAAAVAKLRHPNIIQVYDFNHEGSTYFIVFEFIPGESLQSYLKRLNETKRLMPYPEAVETTAKVADALEYAHEQGLIHRDVKPANVMINVRQEPILMDFGIAKIVGGTQHTATGAVLGTARYMSPEQIRGQQIDARTDIYSLGAMLYETLSGRPPFEADSAMTLMMMHIQDPVPDLGQIRPDAPPDLTAVTYKALAKERADRYQTAAEFAQALRTASLDSEAAPLPVFAQTAIAAAAPTLLDPDPVSAVVEPQQVEALPTHDGKNPLWKWLLIGGGLLAAILVIIFAILQLSGPSEGSAATATETPAAVVAVETETAVPTPTQRPTATAVPAVSESLPPTLEPVSLPPTETPLPAVHINEITIQDGHYIADFETVGFEPDEESLHLHFFFNTTSPENAGRPGSGPFEMVANPSPFTTYTVNGQPEGATQLCALVANPNHTVQFESGNCVDLPAAPTEAPLTAATTAPTATIAAPAATTAPRVQITGISEENGRYSVNFQAFGYTPTLPGMHVHFFFNTVTPENAGHPGSGPWKLYGGPSPFTEYTTSDRPYGAGQLCILVANPDHSIQLGTGNCVNLP
ncbi:MAG: protein kinase [Chloroflexota bacterium]